MCLIREKIQRRTKHEYRYEIQRDRGAKLSDNMKIQF